MDTTETKLVELDEHLKKCTKLIKDLNEAGVNLTLKVVTTTGGSSYKEFAARKPEASSVNISVSDATRTESLIKKSTEKW